MTIYHNGEIIANLLDDLPRHLPKELVQTLIQAGDVSIERIVSHGHASPEGFGTTKAGMNG